MLKSDFITTKLITEGFSENLLGPVSHDLTIDKIIFLDDRKAENKENWEIQPSDTVFIQCEQKIELPNDIIGIVHGKNSRIRQGIDLVSPIYQPGHKTKVFFRITNISSEIIYLKKGDKIAQISFDRAEGDEKICYSGAYQDEFDYRGLGKYENEYFSKKAENKIATLEEMEKKIYCGVASILTVLIAVFGFFNTGIKIGNETNIAQVFFFLTLSLGTLITGLFSIIGFIFTDKHKLCKKLAIVSIGLFVALFLFVIFSFSFRNTLFVRWY